MSKCDCCKEENSELITFRGYRICPACYMGYTSKVKACENNAKYEAEIDQLKQQLEGEKAKVLDLKMRLKGSTKELDKMLNDILHNENKRLIQQLAEKDKEIKNLNHKLNAEEPCLIRNYKDMLVQLKQSQAQLAIQELEKVKTLIQNAINFEKPNFVEVYDAINKQINDLRGEKDVKD